MKKADDGSESMTVEQFKDAARHGYYNEYDGVGEAYRGEERLGKTVCPSCLDAIPPEATYIRWYGK